MKYLALFLALHMLPLALLSQGAAPCGTVGNWSELVGERLKAHKSIRNSGELVQFRETQYVPIKFHLVAQNDGGGRVPVSRVLDQLCALNRDFESLDIQFYIKGGFNLLDNSAVYDDHVPTINTIMTFNQDPDAMNIWVVNDATPSNDNDVGITLGYYDPRKDWIVVNRDYINDNNSILTHEVGHFFSLIHPHNGWDSEPYRDEDKPAPATSPGGVLTERVDRSNCDVAGDYLCDTPADYNGLGIGCDFSLNIFDPDSTLIDPDETNFMSYFLACRREEYQFSPSQKDIMTVDLADESRDRLRRTQPSTTEVISQPPVLDGPIDNEDAPGNGTVTLFWQPVEGARSYLVEVARTPDMNIQRQTFTTNQISFELSGLNIGTRYFWRIKPYNDYYTCAPYSLIESFVAVQGTAVANTIGQLEQWTVAPNPIRSQQPVTLSLRSTESFEADIQLFALSGQLLRSLGRQRIPQGDSQWSLPIRGLAPGVYLVALVSEAGRARKRLVVSR